MEYTLFGAECCMLTPVIKSVAEITGDKINFKVSDGSDHKDLDFNIKFGTPVLATQFGKIFGGSTILRFLARGSPYTNLYGRTSSDAAHVDMILQYTDTTIFSLFVTIFRKNGDVKQALSEFTNILEHFNKYFTCRTFVAGERITIADILLAVSIDSSIKCSDEALSLKNFVNVQRYVDTILAQPSVKKHYGEYIKNFSAFKVCQAKSNSGSACTSEEKPKKKENPLDCLPPTSMSMDEWKRIYSNTKDLKGVAMPWLYQNFDASGYSFYYMKYNKLPDELDVAFRASNMVGGFLQRLDNNFRKHSFGVINIVGEGNDFDYQGVFMFRGLDIPEEMRSHPSFEYHTFTKLDFSKADDKKLITDYFCNDDEVEGLKIQDCKVWK
ncbi:elongation factor 1-gamma [Cryptosporidium ubiquitum]|uniref:Elongation factor 1-gamma n=1 Tax=Cryptosporidium ubiquitum TaxID=857276 RepID=A0A1J4MLE2_9CRYT|nr:elongation factor 1-gamma [Cryptosporidium ubiquitum]OII75006.1 elongation factor 1-gamma [Cryptosporidium ubiquitum]